MMLHTNTKISNNIKIDFEKTQRKIVDHINFVYLRCSSCGRRKKRLGRRFVCNTEGGGRGKGRDVEITFQEPHVMQHFVALKMLILRPIVDTRKQNAHKHQCSRKCAPLASMHKCCVAVPNGFPITSATETSLLSV